MDDEKTSALERLFWKEISIGKKVTVELSVSRTVIYAFYSYHKVTRQKFKNSRQLFQVLSVMSDNTVIFDSRITEETWISNIDPKALEKCYKVIIMPIMDVPDEVFYNIHENRKKLMPKEVSDTNESTIEW
ncbi:HT motif gene family protein [Canarypox virus]|uniref:CNPV280 HT motif protein n=1 Tax=Canarypox virus TaxID=44088 RepID=Q6VZ67_CNPV|nr:HT motif gene family protein [Canarypox virus]AAR83626.1 CNPV280 HT motif protein [Canarypox virus]AWD84756.1 HT motif protein [Canarypox virus]